MNTALPHISIIVPTHARPRQLSACLQALTSLDYPRDRCEIIVVDDGSPLALESCIAPFQARATVRLLRQRQAGPAAARNHGAQHARGDLIAFTDDDCAPACGWLRALAAQLPADARHMVGGHTINIAHTNLYATASQLLISYLYAYYNCDPAHAQFFTSNNMALPAALFHDVGGFDTSFPRAAAEDREFCDRWRAHDLRLVYVPEALVHHAHQLTLRSYIRQHFNYGRGAYHFHRGRAHRRQQRVQVEPLRFYTGLLLAPCGRRPGWQALLLVALLGLSQAANALGFFWERACVPQRQPVCSSADTEIG